ncbi:MAG: hypothetical protein WD431_13430 [Cyclobacteriaceae bacterium]
MFKPIILIFIDHMPLNKIIVLLGMLFLQGSSPPDEPYKVRGKVSIFPQRTLKWEDFKKVDVIKGKTSINAICISSCEVEILALTPLKDHVYLTIEAKVQLQKELTQVNVDFLSRSDERIKSQVLHHENGHFLIAQIIGHRIVRDVNAYKFHPKNYKVQLNAIIRENFKDWNRLDSQYDAQTTKPRNKEMQMKWDRFFLAELEDLKTTIY